MSDDWEPLPHERQWYRHVTNGDKGYLVRKDGTDYIRSDRPTETNERVFRPQDWIAELEPRPFTEFHVAQICFAADQRLRFLLGRPDALRETWLDLSEDKRLAWMRQGPRSTMRAELYRAIQAAMSPYTKV